LAAKKRSKGAPSAICRAKSPVEPSVIVADLPLTCSKRATSSRTARAKSAAAATRNDGSVTRGSAAAIVLANSKTAMMGTRSIERSV
jgi:hypothetical protein